MAKENYQRLLTNMLKECEKYRNAFEEGAHFEFFGVLPAPDESARIGLRKMNGKIEYYFNGSYFGGYVPELKPTVENVSAQLEKFRTKSEEIAINFKSALSEILGRYLAEKKLKNMEKILLK